MFKKMEELIEIDIFPYSQKIEESLVSKVSCARNSTQDTTDVCYDLCMTHHWVFSTG